MSEANKNFTELDFEATKQNLIDYLKQKTEFQDFNFEGSAMNILLDALAYTTTMLAVQANLSISECFLDSAQIRSSIVSRAKELGYIPRSKNAADAMIKVALQHPDSTSGLTDIVLPRGTRFIGTVQESGFTFVNTTQVTLLEERDENNAIVNPGVYVAEIPVYEGTLVSETFEFIEDGLNTRFRLNNKEIDTRFLRVTTRPTFNSTDLTNWSPSTDYVTVGPDSQVYFVQEGIDEFYEVYFGDGIIGAKPSASAVVETEYLVTSGSEANGIDSFDIIDTITRNPGNAAVELYDPEDFTVTTVERSKNASERETSEEIRNAAPKAYKSQRRAVTREDYIALLQSEFGFIDTINAWGGEENIPPAYGRVFVSIKPKLGTTLSPLTKADIVDTLTDKYTIIGVIPEIVDPDYTYVRVNTDVFYRKQDTTLLDGELINEIRNNVTDFFTNNVSFFNGSFRFSKFVTAIDAADASIDGNDTDLTIAKKFTPIPNRRSQITLDCNNAIEKNSVVSEGFTSGGQTVSFKDNGNGRLDFYVGTRLSSIGVGEVDYENGIITINNFVFNVADNTEIVIEATPSNRDLFTARNNLIILDTTTVNLKRIGIDA